MSRMRNFFVNLVSHILCYRENVGGAKAGKLQGLLMSCCSIKGSAHRQQSAPEPGAEVDVVVQLEGADAYRIVHRLLRQESGLQTAAPLLILAVVQTMPTSLP